MLPNLGVSEPFWRTLIHSAYSPAWRAICEEEQLPLFPVIPPLFLALNVRFALRNGYVSLWGSTSTSWGLIWNPTKNFAFFLLFLGCKAKQKRKLCFLLFICFSDLPEECRVLTYPLTSLFWVYLFLISTSPPTPEVLKGGTKEPSPGDSLGGNESSARLQLLCKHRILPLSHFWNIWNLITVHQLNLM